MGFCGLGSAVQQYLSLDVKCSRLGMRDVHGSSSSEGFSS